jgi:ribose transport system substrate-binding protein
MFELRRLRPALLSLAVLGVALTMTACSRSSNKDNAASGEKQIAFVVGTTSDAFYQKAHEGAAEEAKKLGVGLIYQGPAEFTPAAQTPVLDSLLTKKPDALAIAPTDPAAMVAPVRRWSQDKIPVVTYDSSLTNPGFPIVSSIQSNNLAGGKAAADLLAKEIGGAGKVALISTDTSNLVQADRATGFRQQLKDKYPNINVVASQLVGIDYPRAQTFVQTIAAKYRDLKGFFTTCSYCTEYAAKGLEGLHKQNTIAQVGYEAGPKEISYLRSGVLRAVVAQDPAEEGRRAVQYAVAAANGEDAPKTVQLQPVAITRANVDQMQRYYYETSGG